MPRLRLLGEPRPRLARPLLLFLSFANAAAAASTTLAAAVSSSPPAVAGGGRNTGYITALADLGRPEFSRIDRGVLSVKCTLGNVLSSVGGFQEKVNGGALNAANVEVFLQKLVDNFATRSPALRDNEDARERHFQIAQLTDNTPLWKKNPSLTLAVFSGSCSRPSTRRQPTCCRLWTRPRTLRR